MLYILILYTHLIDEHTLDEVKVLSSRVIKTSNKAGWLQCNDQETEVMEKWHEDLQLWV